MELKYKGMNNEEYEILKSNVDEELNKYCAFTKDSVLALDDNNVVGYYGIGNLFGNPEISVGIFKEYRNKGYASQITKDLVNKLMTDDVRGISIKIDKNNKKSMELAKKNGFYIDWDYEEAMSERDTDYIVMTMKNYNYGVKHR